MKALLEGFDPQSTINQSSVAPKEKAWSVHEKKAALEAIGSYNEYSRKLFRETNLMEIAHKLGEITSHAQRFISEELEERKKTDESAWFDAETPKRNLTEINKSIEEFKKHAMEAHVLEQRMQSIYETIGHRLNHYFEIKNLDEGAPAVPRSNKK